MKTFRVAIALMILLAATAAQGGGPAFVVTIGGMAKPAAWPDGVVRYYTDVGDLSPVLPQADADALVAEAFAHWTSVPTAAIVAIHAGRFAQDFSGATTTGVAILYDAGGQVTEALLGPGESAQCPTNMVFGGPDAFTEDGRIAHALVVVNGACVQTAAEIPALRETLVRVLGRVLGLDWSRLNDVEDCTAWPLMNSHSQGRLCHIPDGELPRMDDRAALSRLYPVTAANIPQFTGKQIFADTTARVSGTVRSADGRALEGMNVVARLLDPITGVPSRRDAASCVSGFLSGGKQRRVSSAMRGWFDLAGLEIPAGGDNAQYQISVERNGVIAPGAQTVTLARGSQITVDLVMSEVVAEKLVLVFGTNPGVPVGAQAPNPIRVRAVDKDGAPVAGASITFSASPAGALLFSPCNLESCTLVSDGAGEAATAVTVKQEGVVTVTASLANGASVQTTVLGIAQPLTATAVVPRFWVAAHASVAIPLTTRVLENGVAASGQSVNYKIMSGAGALGSTGALTNAQGDATTVLNLTNITGDVQASACVAPNNAPCASFTVLTVMPESMRIQKIGGDQQGVTVGQALQAVTVRVTDASSPPNPVLAAAVKFTTAAFHLLPEGERTVVGEVVITHPSQPVPALPGSETTVLTDASGAASICPAFAKELGALDVMVSAQAGAAQATFAITIGWPGTPSGTAPPASARRGRSSAQISRAPKRQNRAIESGFRR